MSNVIDIATHKDYQPIYAGVTSRVKDKQKLMNMSLQEMLDSDHISGKEFRDRIKHDLAIMETWFEED